jgi:hypothetical protein
MVPAIATVPAPPQKPQRTKLVPATITDEIRTLATEARSKLDYTVLEDRVIGNTLKETLAKLEIEPFNYEQVRRYMGDVLNSRFGPESIMIGYHYWERTALDSYKAPVPEFVLSKALQIKEELPDAQFFVDSCRFHPDPFLAVKLGNEMFYIEVWDEPEFESKL